jgi:hypothetical protein
MVNPDVAEIFSNAPPPPPGFTTPLDYLKSFTKEKDIIDAYHAGKISEGEAELGLELLNRSLKNKASVDTYGKVVDQNGQPVVGAEVHGIVGLGSGDTEKHDTTTSAQGLFDFLGLHGQGMTMEIEKKGYYFDYMLPSAHRPNNYLPDPAKPLVFTMWKLHGPEPMMHADIESSLPRDGTMRMFNVLTGNKDVSGDLTVQLLREPLEIAAKDLRKPFNWSLTLTITNGGLLGYTNQPYPYEAPMEGYQKVFTMSFPSNMIGWQSWFKHDYYFNAEKGGIYGRMTVEVHAGAPTPEAYFRIDTYANPAGSRNLEFDPQKQIQN